MIGRISLHAIEFLNLLDDVLLSGLPFHDLGPRPNRS